MEVSDGSTLAVNPGIGKCGVACGDRVRRQNPLGSNVTNFSKSHDVNSTCLVNLYRNIEQERTLRQFLRELLYMVITPCEPRQAITCGLTMCQISS